MTRINLVPPRELMDQHLFAEFREIKMIPKSFRRSIAARGLIGTLKIIPQTYRLGAGHVSFFYDKGLYLFRRYDQLRAELDHRNINYNKESPLDPDGMYDGHIMHTNYDYVPTAEAVALVRARIAEKVAMKPEWYRYTNGEVYER